VNFKFQKLRWRLLVTFLLPLLLMAGIVGYANVKLDEAVKFSRALNASAHIPDDILNVGDSWVRMQRASFGYTLINGNQGIEMGYPKAIYEASRNAAHEKIDDLSKSDTTGRLADTIQQLKEVTLRIELNTSQLVKLIDDGKEKEAIEFFRKGSSIALARDTDKISAKLAQDENEFRTRLRDSVTSSIERAQNAVMWGSVFAVFLMLVFGAWTFAALSRGITNSANQVSVVATQFASVMAEHEQSVQEQASAVVETTSTVEELAASSRVTASQAESVATSARQAQETTQKGMALAARNKLDMSQLEASSTHIAAEILALSEQAAQIGNISKLVGELAGETNMLALNAAVEAARAGEHGKGFSVVASEIRKLADQSKQSAEKSNQIVTDIQKATNTIVMAAETSSKTSREVGETVRQSVVAFEGVNELAIGVHQNAQQVLLNTKQQADAMLQIDEAMKNIKNGAKAIAIATSQARAGVANLTDVAIKLKTML
jgi:methyl-accepting chemotaxis protein